MENSAIFIISKSDVNRSTITVCNICFNFIKINSQKSNQYDWIDTESCSEAEQNESTASPDCPQGRLTHVFVLYVGFCGKLSKP